MSLPIWVKSLQARIERVTRDRPSVMITYIAAEKEEWGCVLRFSKETHWKYCRKEVYAVGMIELMEKMNAVADDFIASVTAEELDAESIPF